MFTTYDETVSWIHSLLPHGIKPGTKRVEWMLKQLGNPEKKLTSIHIGGTNGKGSTVTFLRCMLQEANYKVGTFTSPYIERFNERISVNGEPILDDSLIEMANRVQPLVEQLAKSDLKSPTEFEVITVMAITYFAYTKPDIVLFEVGLGGRLDSTNVIAPLLSIITNIDYDHTAILGETIEKIAFEKAGIIKPEIPVVSAVQKPKALKVIQKTCHEKQANLYLLNKQFHYKHYGISSEGESFSFSSSISEYGNLIIKMSGEHQVKNASTALMAIDVLSRSGKLRFDETSVRKGLRKALWPGRFETVSRNPLIILDGAHNPDGVKNLAKTIKLHYPDKKINVIFACLQEKDIDKMLTPLYKVARKITFTSFSFHRAADAEDIYNRADFPSKFFAKDWRKTVRNQMDESADDELLVVTGSLYFISQVRNFLKISKKQ